MKRLFSAKSFIIVEIVLILLAALSWVQGRYDPFHLCYTCVPSAENGCLAVVQACSVSILADWIFYLLVLIIVLYPIVFGIMKITKK